MATRSVSSRAIDAIVVSPSGVEGVLRRSGEWRAFIWFGDFATGVVALAATVGGSGTHVAGTCCQMVHVWLRLPT